MAFDKAKTSFAQIEDKFRKAFNLAGLIGATFEPSIAPTLIIGNTDDPGYASFRGRHFAFASDNQSAPPAANGIFGWFTPVDVILHDISFVLQASGNSAGQVYLIAPGGTMPAFATANAGSWIDQKLSAADAVPFSVTTGTVVSAPTVATFAQTNRIALFNSTLSRVERRMHLAAGSAIIWDYANVAASGVRLGLSGRIW